jgi:hypothetical protein
VFFEKNGLGPLVIKACKSHNAPKKKFLATKGIKIQEKIWMKKSHVNHGLQR